MFVDFNRNVVSGHFRRRLSMAAFRGYDQILTESGGGNREKRACNDRISHYHPSICWMRRVGEGFLHQSRVI
jgi:hypothetical protein